MISEGVICQWLSYVRLLERFKADKRIFDFEHGKTEFEVDLCRNDEHVIVKMYKLLLKLEREGEQVKDWMIKRAKNFVHNIQMEQWQDMG